VNKKITITIFQIAPSKIRRSCDYCCSHSW